MFNLGAGEVLVILLLALIVLGPQRLPDAAKQVGKFMGEMRKLSSGFQNELKHALDDDSEAQARKRGAAVTRPGSTGPEVTTPAIESASTEPVKKAVAKKRAAPLTKANVEPAEQAPAKKKAAVQKAAAKKKAPAKKAASSR